LNEDQIDLLIKENTSIYFTLVNLKTVAKSKLFFIFNLNISTSQMKNDKNDKNKEEKNENKSKNITLVSVNVYLIHSPK
jgi:uncharacterized protein YqhQ